jgi:hypothetical protein
VVNEFKPNILFMLRQQNSLIYLKNIHGMCNVMSFGSQNVARVAADKGTEVKSVSQRIKHLRQ